MTLNELIHVLSEFDVANSSITITTPSGNIPAHFHVTEIGRVQKTFIDCGGTRRETASCLLQIWTADDIDHRLLAGKLLKIIDLARNSIDLGDLPVEIEYGDRAAAQYKLEGIEITPQGVGLFVTGKRTDCLAPDKCGIKGCC